MEYYTIKPVKEYKVRKFLWEIIMTLLIITGIILSGSNDIGLQSRDTAAILLAVDITTIMCAIFSRFQKIGRYHFVIPAVLAPLILIVLQGNFYKGLLGLVNNWIYQWNEKYHDARVLFDVKNVQEKDLLSVFCVFVFCMLAIVMKTIQNKNIAPSFFVISILCMFEIIHGKVTIIVIIFDIVSMAAMWMYMLAGNLDMRRILWLTAIVALMLGLFFAGNRKMISVRQSKKKIAKQTEQMAYGTDNLPQGDLYKAGMMHRGKPQQRLTIVSAQVKDVYLRGFIGDEYSDGTWKTFYNEKFGGDNNQMISWLEQKNFSPVSQFADYVKAGDVEILQNKIRIEQVNANSKYIYTPYSAEYVKDNRIRKKNDNGYRNTPFLGLKSYEYLEYSENIPAELIRVENWMENPENELQEDYAEAEKEYRDFVYHNYLYIPANIESLIIEAFHEENDADKEKDGNGIYQTAVTIRKKLEILVSYEKNMRDIPAEQEPVKWFLTQTGKGNEALYATAATFAFRSYGIPARYVEGYLYRGNQNRDTIGQKYILTDEQAHAWTEVYMDGIGWIPIDTTPGYYYDTYAMIQMVDSAMEQKQMEEQTDKNENANKIVNNRRNKKTNTELISQITQKTGTIIYGLIVLFLLLFVIIIVVILLCRGLTLYGYRRTVEKSSGRDKTTALSNRIFILFKALGMDAQVGWKVKETQEQLRKALPGMMEGEYEAVNLVLEKFIYGEEELKSYDEDLLERFIDKIHQEITKLPKIRQIKFVIRDTFFLIKRR